MKVLILGDASNPHIIKWANGLQSSLIKIKIFSLVDFDSSELKSGIEVTKWTVPFNLKLMGNGNLLKLMYLAAVPAVLNVIKKYKPDIIHAHYASSYGILGALTNFHPFILSVWGADVFTFPKKSFLHKKLFSYNLKKADRILSTSKIMAEEIKLYTHKDINITPFGIDSALFKPGIKAKIETGDADFIIGTIKGLEEQYGIEYLIDAFCIAKSILKDRKLKLVIVGWGTQADKIKNIIREKNLGNEVILTGRVKYSEIAKYHNLLDIYIALSVMDDESFGVAVLEACSTEKPVIVSRVGGLPEIVSDGETGFIVPPRDARKAAEKIAELLQNEQLRKEFGQKGRAKVINEYEWKKSLDTMIGIYQQSVS